MGRSQVQFNRTHGRRPGGRGRGRGQEQSQPQKQQQQNAKQLEKLGDNSWRFQEDRKHDDDDVHGNNNEDDDEDLRLNQFLEQPQQKYIYSSSSASTTSEYRNETESSASMINLVELSSWWPQGLVAKLALLPTTKRLRLPSHIVATFAEQEVDDKEYEILQQPKTQLHQFEQDPSIWKGTFSQPSNIATTTQSHNTNDESNHVTGKVDAVAITLTSSSVDDAKSSVSRNTTNMDPSTSGTTGDSYQLQSASEEKNTMEDDGEDDLDAWLDSVIS